MAYQFLPPAQLRIFIVCVLVLFHYEGCQDGHHGGATRNGGRYESIKRKEMNQLVDDGNDIALLKVN